MPSQQVEQIADPLRRRKHIAVGNRLGKQSGIKRIGQLLQHRKRDRYPPYPRLVGNDVQRSGLRRRDTQRTARGVHRDRRHPFDILFQNELDMDLAAPHVGSAFAGHDLKSLRSLMGRAVQFGRAEKRDTVRFIPETKEVRNELIGRQTPDIAVCRGNDHMEAATGCRNFSVGR